MTHEGVVVSTTAKKGWKLKGVPFRGQYLSRFNLKRVCDVNRSSFPTTKHRRPRDGGNALSLTCFLNLRLYFAVAGSIPSIPTNELHCSTTTIPSHTHTHTHTHGPRNQNSSQLSDCLGFATEITFSSFICRLYGRARGLLCECLLFYFTSRSECSYPCVIDCLF